MCRSHFSSRLKVGRPPDTLPAMAESAPSLRLLSGGGSLPSHGGLVLTAFDIAAAQDRTYGRAPNSLGLLLGAHGWALRFNGLFSQEDWMHQGGVCGERPARCVSVFCRRAAELGARPLSCAGQPRATRAPSGVAHAPTRAPLSSGPPRRKLTTDCESDHAPAHTLATPETTPSAQATAAAPIMGAARIPLVRLDLDTPRRKQVPL